MHLAVNGSDLGRQRGGNESFILGLLQGLEQSRLPIRLSVLTTAAGVEALRSIDYHGQIVDIGTYHRLAFHFWQQRCIVQNLHPDWYFSTYFLPPGLPCRGAIIVHDVSFRAHPEYFPASIACYMHILTGHAVRQAQVVALDSAFTASEARKYYPERKHKGVVTYPGVEKKYTRPWQSQDDLAALAQYGLNPGYILAIGNIHPRKNLGRLLEAYAGLREEMDAVPEMVWIGLPRWQSADLVKQAAKRGVQLPGYVATQYLPALYRQAAVFVYPSLYEGFGLPVLEAMASGTPVVCSNVASLPEAAGDAALMVDPTDVRDLQQAVLRLLTDTELRQELVARGLRRAEQFTYERTARLLVGALQANEG